MAKLTFVKFRRRLGGIAKELDKAVLPPMRKGIAEVRKRARKEFQETGLGRSLWARGSKRKRSQHPPLVLKTIGARWSRSEYLFKGGLRLKGMTGLLEAGGYTKRHPITPFASSVLKFQARGVEAFRPKVMHPGGNVRSHNIVDKLAKRDWPKMAIPMARAFERVVQRLL